MADATTGFFHELSRGGRRPLWDKARGAVRLDLVERGRTARVAGDPRQGRRGRAPRTSPSPGRDR